MDCSLVLPTGATLTNFAELKVSRSTVLSHGQEFSN